VAREAEQLQIKFRAPHKAIARETSPFIFDCNQVYHPLTYSNGQPVACISRAGEDRF